MSFPAARHRMVDAIFARLGEDAGWSGLADPVRVILREQNDDVQMGDGPIRVDARFIRVRRFEVTTPALGDHVEPVESGGIYKIIAEPMLDRRGIWRCEVAKIG